MQLPRFLQTLLEILLPDKLQVVGSLLAASLVYIVVSGGYIWDRLTGGDIALKDHASSLLESVYSIVDHLPGASNAAVALLWGIGGIVIYVLVLLIANFFVNTHNNTALNQPLQHKPKLLALALLSQYRRIVWIALFATILVVAIAWLIPTWFRCFDVFNRNHYDAHYLVFGIIGLSYTLYLLFASTVAVIRNPQIFR